MNEDKAARYNRLKRNASVLSLVVSVACVVAFLVTGASIGLRDFAERIATRKPELTVGEITDFYERIDRVIRRAGANNSAVSIPTDVAPDLTFTRAAAEVIHQIGLARIGAQPSRFSANDL